MVTQVDILIFKKC